MSGHFEKMANELQASIMEDARKVYSEKVIERWLNPRNLGKIRAPDGFAKIKGPCGDTMQISFKVKDGKLSKIKFRTDGCASSIAAGSMATELAQGRKIEDAVRISQEMILYALDGLPEESIHCALLASDTLHEAIQSYLRSKGNASLWERDKDVNAASEDERADGRRLRRSACPPHKALAGGASRSQASEGEECLYNDGPILGKGD